MSRTYRSTKIAALGAFLFFGLAGCQKMQQNIEEYNINRKTYYACKPLTEINITNDLVENERYTERGRIRIFPIETPYHEDAYRIDIIDSNGKTKEMLPCEPGILSLILPDGRREQHDFKNNKFLSITP